MIYFQTDRGVLHQGHVMDILKGMKAENIHCVVTSPPYWGLRDYGIEPQVWNDGKFTLGLEETPELFISHIVQVFREVKRVLHKSGSVWLNLGSSYASSNMYPNQSPAASRAPSYGTDDKEQSNLKGNGRVCPDSDGECQGDCQDSHNQDSHNDQQNQQFSLHSSQKGHDNERLNSFEKPLHSLPSDAQESTNPSCIGHAQGVSDHEAKASVSRKVREKDFGDSHQSSCTCHAECNPDKSLTHKTSASHKSDTELSCKAYEPPNGLITNNLSIPYPNVKFKPKDLIMIPHMVALALQADGWYLRSAMPWVKRSAMPESCSDRPASALEYVFLLSKNGKYFFDMDAIRVAHKYPDDTNRPRKERGTGSKTICSIDSPMRILNPAGRNYRNTDLFYESIKPPHGMIFCGDEPVGLDVNPQPFNSAVFYGSYRIVSPCCPVHGCQSCQLPFRQCDEQRGVCQLRRNLHTYIHHELGQSSFVSSIALNLPEVPLDFPSAIVHNIENYKKAFSSKQGEISCDKSAFHTECKEHNLRCASNDGHIPENNIEVDSVSDAKEMCPLEQIFYHTTYIPTFEVPPDDCLCHYTGKVKKCQDHFAVFPEKLVEPCIKAGISEKGCCPECLEPYARVVEKTNNGKIYERGTCDTDCRGIGSPQRTGSGTGALSITSKTIGWKPGCDCKETFPDGGSLPLIPIPCVCLDPFFGSGTVAVVAERYRRNWIGIELSEDYAKIAEKRVNHSIKQRRLF